MKDDDPDTIQAHEQLQEADTFIDALLGWCLVEVAMNLVSVDVVGMHEVA